MDRLEEKAVRTFRAWLRKLSPSQAHYTKLFGCDTEAGEHIEVKPEEAVDLFLRLPEGQEFSGECEVLLQEARTKAGRGGHLDLSKERWNAEQARAAKKQ